MKVKKLSNRTYVVEEEALLNMIGGTSYWEEYREYLQGYCNPIINLTVLEAMYYDFIDQKLNEQFSSAKDWIELTYELSRENKVGAEQINFIVKRS